ncbi:MAG: ribosome biogenesis GTPase Der [Chloroflexota bacterium]
MGSIKAGLPVVAIVGRPNVGKSTLFNRIVGKRQAIVEDRARTTRDRMYGDGDWNGRRFIVVDTGGLEVDPNDPIELKVQEQAQLAIGEADVILFLVDAVAGLTPADEEAAELLRRSTKPVIVAANKADNEAREIDAAEFYALGWEETYPISASHGRGTGDLLDAIVWALPHETEEERARKAREKEADEWARDVAAGRLEPFVVGDEEADEEDGDPGAVDEVGARWDAALAAAAEDDEPAAIAFVGRPNVGKSSLLNALLGEDRAIVSEVPGTTRDAIDTTLEWGRSQIVLIDTAGIRRRGKVASGPTAERFSTLRSLKAIGRADVAVLVIDAVDGLTAQDAHVAGYVVEEGRGLVVAVNKWDLVEDKTDRTFDQYVEWIRNQTPFLDFAPVVSISAKTHQRVGRVLELAVDIWGERRKRIATAELNRVIRAATDRQQPPVVKGRRPKIFYGTQAAVAPPTFVFFANDAASVHFSYRRYLENRLRDEFGFHGTPLKLIFRDRSSVRLPRRRRQPQPARRKASAGGRSAGGRSAR